MTQSRQEPMVQKPFVLVSLIGLGWLTVLIVAHDPIEPICVRLPNGLSLVPEARIHLLRGSFQPGILILDPNGQELSGIGASSFSFSQTTAIWFDPNRPQESDISMVRLAYRNDVGLVSRASQGQLFQEVHDNFGERLDEPGEWYLNRAEDVWAQLKGNPNYRDEACEIPLIAWSRSETGYRAE